MIVVLTEKPSVAREISRILKATKKEDGYFEGNGYVVTWAYGHLVELFEPQEYDPSFKNWSLQTLPIIPENFKLKVSSDKGVRKQFSVIKRLLKEAETIVCATDAGREGELIFRYIQQACNCQKKNSKRLWINSLTDSAIIEGFKNLQPLSNFDTLAAAAKCRSEADWIIGMNATRGYTVKYGHGQGVLSVGRVQTPVLALIVQRDKLIRDFKPEDYWEVWTQYQKVKFKHTTDKFKNKEEAEALLKKVKGQEFSISKIEQKTSSTPPPLLFDLTEIQRVMNKRYGFSATKTLTLCQTLYEKKYISYPRTDSRYLPEDLHSVCKQTLQKLLKNYEKEISVLNLDDLSRSKRIFNKSKVTDHHAIVPTGQVFSAIDRDEASVYETIVIRFIAVFYPNLEKSHTTVYGLTFEEIFIARGTQILIPGWFVLYQSDKSEEKDDEQILPIFTLGESGSHIPEIKNCRTKPPLNFTEATLLTAMETAGKAIDDDELKEAMKEKGLGTPATRASIIETLVKRDYIQKDGKKILSSRKGEDLITLLQKNQILSSAEMTAEWEYRLKEIEKGKYQADDFMIQIKKLTVQIVDSLKNESSESIDTNNLGRCPLCSSPVIKGNIGYGCSSWKNGCTFRFHAEQFGTSIADKDVPILLNKRRLSHPRNLVIEDNRTVQGYLIIDSLGKINYITREDDLLNKSIGKCPGCNGSVIEKYQSFSCSSCEFCIWKKIASRDISPALAQVLLNKGKTQKLNGFKSKTGKNFSAALKIENRKVTFEF